MSIYPGMTKKVVSSIFLCKSRVHGMGNEKCSKSHKISSVDFHRACRLEFYLEGIRSNQSQLITKDASIMKKDQR